MSSTTFTYGNGIGITANAVLTTNNPGTINWGTLSSGSSNGYNYTIGIDPNLKGSSLEVNGDANFNKDVDINGDLTLQGKSLKDSLDKIEERLAILHPNEELEKKWEKLRGLRKMYMELEQEIIEKEKMWAILKR